MNETTRRQTAGIWLGVFGVFIGVALLLGGCAKPRPSSTITTTPPAKTVTILASQTLLFESGQYAIKPAAQKTLDQVANLVRGQPSTWVHIEGHADDGGSDRFNQDLSELRALSVMKALIERGVPKSLVKTVAYGKSNPAPDNAADAKTGSAGGRGLNRRVNILVISDQPATTRN